MWIFNCAKHLPVYYRLMADSVKDVSAFKVCMEDSGMRGGIAIIDKGFRLIALQWYYDLSDRLKKAELSNKYAPMDMVRSLSRVRTVRVDKKWIPAEVMKKDRPLIQAVGLDITPDSGIL